MTTGSYGTTTIFYDTFEGLDFYKQWDGTNGKWESYAGGYRPKWNNYTWFGANRVRPTKYYQIGYPWGPGGSVLWFDSTASLAINNSVTWESQDTLRLQSKLLRQIKGHDFDLAVNLAQMGQVSRMVSFNLGQLGRSVLALKRGDFATAARALGTRPRASRLKATDVGGRWLELQYGWRPLLSDSYEAVKAFHEISKGPRSTLFRTSVAKGGIFEGSQSPSIFTAKFKEKLTTYLQYEMYEEMSIERQLGLTDPLSVAWELIPYSFVVDWFVPIGTYLDNLNAIPKLKGRFLTTTTRRQSGYFDWSYRTLNQYPGDAVALQGWPMKDVMNQYSGSRVFSTSLEVPLPKFDLRGAIHGRRVWNAISLAQLRFGRRAPRNVPAPGRTGPRIHLFRGNTFIPSLRD